MPEDIQNVFNEYTRLRLNGLEATEAVRTLHPHVKDFDDNMREDLARLMRAWESERTEKISFVDRQKLTELAAAKKANQSTPCPECGKDNESHSTICYSCGALMSPILATSTDILPPETGEFASIDDAHFGENYVLILMPEEDQELEPYTLRPQMKETGLTIGRSGENNDVDVDLEAAGASEKGVSRLHATIVYDEFPETLALLDMGSTNGSFINGQRLQVNERRAIRHSDEIRFGRMKFRVIYKVNGS